MMRLVDDDEVEGGSEQMLRMLASSSRRDRRDNTFLRPERVRIVAQQLVVGRRERQAEFGLQFLPPLPDERGRRQHQHPLRHATQRIFLEDHTGLDGFSEADLVGKQHTAAELLQNLSHGLDLMPEWFDAGEVRQAEKFVEALSKAEMGEPLAQPPPSALPFGHTRNRMEQGRKVNLGRKGDVDFDSRQGLQRDCRDLSDWRRGLAGRARWTRWGDFILCRTRLAPLRSWRVAVHDRVDLSHHPTHTFPSTRERLE